jgi:hypothetical protein
MAPQSPIWRRIFAINSTWCVPETSALRVAETERRSETAVTAHEVFQPDRRKLSSRRSGLEAAGNAVASDVVKVSA